MDGQGLLDLVKYGFTTRIQFKRSPQLAAARKRAWILSWLLKI